MMLKAFELELQSHDPKPLHIEVKNHLFGFAEKKLFLVAPERVRELGEEDFIDFDSTIAPLIGVSINDLVHGDYGVKTLEYSLTPGSTYLQVVQVRDKLSGTASVLFKVFQATDGGLDEKYSENQYVKKPVRERLRLIAEVLGIDISTLEEETAKLGIKLD
ncbi:hypothetical protein [Infirmifilum sp. SLHALR2]|nr:MAG: hypothetical protein B7L53_05760 [Thermofilum sp. NZ13]